MGNKNFSRRSVLPPTVLTRQQSNALGVAQLTNPHLDVRGAPFSNSCDSATFDSPRVQSPLYERQASQRSIHNYLAEDQEEEHL